MIQCSLFMFIDSYRLEVSPETAVSAEYASAFLSEGLCSHREDESDSNLSDLDDDIQQYIASDKEVIVLIRLSSCVLKLNFYVRFCLTVILIGYYLSSECFRHDYEVIPYQ